MCTALYPNAYLIRCIFVLYSCEVLMDNSQPMRCPDWPAKDDTFAVALQKIVHTSVAQSGGLEAWLVASLRELTDSRVGLMRDAVERIRIALRLFEPGFRSKSIRGFAKHTQSLSTLLRRVYVWRTRLAVLDDYIARCDEDTRVGLSDLRTTWENTSDAQSVRLIASINDAPHADWLDWIESLENQNRNAAYVRQLAPGESSHVRHIVHAAMGTRLRDVRAYDTLFDTPAQLAPHVLALVAALQRLHHTIELLQHALPEHTAKPMVQHCRSSLDIFMPMGNALSAAEQAEQFQAQREAGAQASGALAFADAQHKVFESRLAMMDWRACLQPFL